MHSYNILEKGSPLDNASKAIILIHGRGADAEDIITLAEEFVDDTFYVAAPQATGNSWYPYSFISPLELNEPWLTSAVETIKKLIDEITLKVSASDLYIMGFSQGACLSLEVASRYALRYAGVAAFSGGLIGERINRTVYGGNFHSTPVFIGSSDVDPHIPVQRCHESAEVIRSLGGAVTVKIYPGMGHTVTMNEINEVKKLMF